ncbi:hypothetical protein BH10PLA1_BH10PLA1_17370 [soil metagenome]
MRAGMKTLAANGAKYFIHCGDVGGQPIIDCLAGHEASFVWGNNDWDRAGLEEYATGLGINCLGYGGAIELDGKSIYVTHGDDVQQIKRVLEGQTHDYLLMGHTHTRLDAREGRVHIINPGALHRAMPKTVALLNLERDTVQFLEVKD